MEKNLTRLVGILTNPSKTFKMSSRNRVLQLKYDQLPDGFKNKKQSFMDFLGGSFQEINTLVGELASVGDVSVVLYISKNLFISENFRISPYELNNSKSIGKSLDFQRWLNQIDALIIALYREKLQEFINLYSTEVTHMNKPCVISTGKSMIIELSKRFPGRFVLVERKGVARFGADNRRKISALLS